MPYAPRVLVCLLLGSGAVAQENVAQRQDAARVRSTIEAIGVFVDFGEFEAVCQLYDSISTSDYSSLWGNEPTSGSPSSRATGWSGFIPGFDVTRHDIAVREVTVTDNEASASADVTAVHWLDGEMWRITGVYDVVLLKKQDRWLISEWTFTLRSEDGDRELVDRAEALAAGLIERPVRCPDGRRHTER